jgi:hypothetical protein
MSSRHLRGPRKRSNPNMAPQTLTVLSAIAANWHIENVNECIPEALYPDGQSDTAQWEAGLLQQLRSISSIPTATIEDFRTKLDTAIRLRQDRNRTAKGKVSSMTATDLSAVLAAYQREKKDSKKSVASGKRNQIVTKTPITPAPPDYEEEEEDEEEDSEAPVPAGKYIHLPNVKPKKVNLNPDASVAAKPRGKKRGRQAHHDEQDSLRSPNRAYQEEEGDEDPNTDIRHLEDTGFLSPTTDPPPTRQRQSKRLSRIQQDLIRAPHWQDDIPVLPGEAVSQEENQHDDNDSILEGSIDFNVLQIPEGATNRERLDFHRLRRRIWRDEFMVRVLKVEVRMEEERERERGG